MKIRLIFLFLTIGIAGCNSGGDSDSVPIVSTPPPSSNSPPVSSTDNENIDNPTLTTFNNREVIDSNNLKLVWSDEFTDTKLDPEIWYFETGDGSQYGLNGWGNNELQYYQPNSAAIENGVLVITAREESSNGYNYTSARIHTRDRVAVRYGRIEARIKLPAGQGIWPAFWMMPQGDAYGTWAASGEIDIMEAINLGTTNQDQVHGTIHYGDQWPNNVFTTIGKDVNKDVVESFHEYAFEWDENEMRWYFDGELFATQNSWYTANSDFPAPFNESFYILLNLAVGGNWPGSPNSSTIFPVTYEIDYVRVYEGDS